jgi:hypothetical protein
VAAAGIEFHRTRRPSDAVSDQAGQDEQHGVPTSSPDNRNGVRRRLDGLRALRVTDVFDLRSLDPRWLGTEAPQTFMDLVDVPTPQGGEPVAMALLRVDRAFLRRETLESIGDGIEVDAGEVVENVASDAGQMRGPGSLQRVEPFLGQYGLARSCPTNKAPPRPRSGPAPTPGSPPAASGSRPC